MKYLVRCNGEYSVQIDRKSDTTGEIKATVNDKEYRIFVRKTHADGRMKTLIVNHKIIPIEVNNRGDGFPDTVWLKGVPYELEIEKVESTRYRPPLQEKEVSGDILAGLPGQVIDLFVKKGQKVKKGESVGILEAMKMENEILSPKDGIVAEVAVDIGQLVAKGDLLVRIDSLSDVGEQ